MSFGLLATLVGMQISFWDIATEAFISRSGLFSGRSTSQRYIPVKDIRIRLISSLSCVSASKTRKIKSKKSNQNENNILNVPIFYTMACLPKVTTPCCVISFSLLFLALLLPLSFKLHKRYDKDDYTPMVRLMVLLLHKYDVVSYCC